MGDEPFRLPRGGRIDRAAPLRFRFDGRALVGRSGDTVASALLANGVRIAGRSFKYHRPRGIMGAGAEEPAIVVALDSAEGRGNLLPTTLPLHDGLSVQSVHCWPSPRFDLGAVNQMLAPLLPAGFYYKTFMWPGWHLFEPAIRRAAGLAAAPAAPPAQGRFEVRNAHCDLLIAGSGAAGLMAALIAGRAGARVMLVDEGSEAGGSLLNRRATLDEAAAADWIAATVAELAAMPNVTHLQRSTVWAWREHNLAMVQERAPDHPGLIERGWRVRARRVLCATGAIERTLVFAGNDLPGVMLASAAQAYVNCYAVAPGRRAVVFANNDTAWEVARDLHAAGLRVAAVVDRRPDPDPRLRAGLEDVPVLPGHVVQRARGFGTLSAVEVRPVGGDGPVRRIACDLLAVSGGWSPAVHLHSQSRGTLRWDAGILGFVPDRAVQAGASAGAAAGRFGLGATLADAAAVASRLLAGIGLSAPDIAPPHAADEPHGIAPLWSVAPKRPRDKAFVDIQNDVTLADLELAVREGYGAPEHAKRYTTAGMGIDQGKTGSTGVAAILAGLTGQDAGALGPTTFRPPYTPVDFGTIAGGRAGGVLLPWRHTPLTAWHVAAGAVMYEAGARWRRPGYYPRPDEGMAQAVEREARSARGSVAVYDSAPLGTIAVEGRDAARLLDHVGTARYATLPPGKGRYGLMLTEDGLIFDDGVTFRLAENRFLLSCSTGNAEAVGRHLDKVLRLDRPGWDVRVVDLTGQWGNATLCGPGARDVLRSLDTDIDLSPDAFPFMGVRDGQVAGLRARVARVSFTGEMSFEINVAMRDLPALWQALVDAGAQPIGSEANHVLRVEKGFLSLAHEVDGTVDPWDLGMGWAMAVGKGDFIGLRAVRLRRAGGGVRRELVGLRPQPPEIQLPEGAPLTARGGRVASEGVVTACVPSVVCDGWVALALLEDGRARIGGTAHVRLPDRVIPVDVTAPVFHDPAGTRMRG